MFLLIGLGNPGKEYQNTRHNVGFMALDDIIKRYNFSGPKVKFQGEIFDGVIGDEKVLALKPMTYMNLSGRSVKEAASFYKIPLSNIIVFHDEIDLAVGKIKVKIGGGAGGHNGIKDIDDQIGKEYKRVRIGVGHPGEKDKVTGHVLSKPSKDDHGQLEVVISSVSSAVEQLLDGDDGGFMAGVSSR